MEGRRKMSPGGRKNGNFFEILRPYGRDIGASPAELLWKLETFGGRHSHDPKGTGRIFSVSSRPLHSKSCHFLLFQAQCLQKYREIDWWHPCSSSWRNNKPRCTCSEGRCAFRGNRSFSGNNFRVYLSGMPFIIRVVASVKSGEPRIARLFFFVISVWSDWNLPRLKMTGG